MRPAAPNQRPIYIPSFPQVISYHLGLCINIDWREKTTERRRERKKHTHSQTQIVGTEKQIKISMDHSLRCFGKTIPKTHNHFLLFSLSLFLFFFSFFANAAFDLATIPFNDGYSPLFGHGNVVRSSDGNGVQLLLDRYTGKIKLYYIQKQIS